jgi:hypothetical protein
MNLMLIYFIIFIRNTVSIIYMSFSIHIFFSFVLLTPSKNIHLLQKKNINLLAFSKHLIRPYTRLNFSCPKISILPDFELFLYYLLRVCPNHLKSNRRYNVLSFKNLTLQEEKINHNNVLIHLEWR